MESENRGQKTGKQEFSRIINRDLFLFLLDLEVKRARRYQNFLTLVLLKLIGHPEDNQEESLRAYYRVMTEILVGETRDTDLLGSLSQDRLAILLPYADAMAGNVVRSRFERILKYLDFQSNGYEVSMKQITFPNGTNTVDLIKKALEEN